MVFAGSSLLNTALPATNTFAPAEAAVLIVSGLTPPSTSMSISGAAALIVAVILAYRGKSLIQVAAAACAAVFVLELFLVR